MERENITESTDTEITASNIDTAPAEEAENTIETPKTIPESDTPPFDRNEIMGEICAIKESISGMHRGEKVAQELRELRSVIPNADLSLLDDEAFEAIARGEGLVYSYLLSERRRAKIEEANKRNALSSAGDAGGSADTLYTLDEIKRMDQKTVRKNFEKVMKSLERIK